LRSANSTRSGVAIGMRFGRAWTASRHRRWRGLAPEGLARDGGGDQAPDSAACSDPRRPAAREVTRCAPRARGACCACVGAQ